MGYTRRARKRIGEMTILLTWINENMKAYQKGKDRKGHCLQMADTAHDCN